MRGPTSQTPSHSHHASCGNAAVGSESGKRFLAYTSTGCITSKETEGYNVVEVAFHDVSRMRKRIPNFNDFYNLTMAALSDKVGCFSRLAVCMLTPPLQHGYVRQF